MSGYAKLFSDIVDSSIWSEPSDVCKVWITMLALSDADGFVRGSDGWLAGKAKVTVALCQEAIKKFTSPDPQSRTPDNEGRRVEVMPDGWLILNYLTFRDRLSPDPKACATRDRVRKHRERYKALRNASSVTCRVSASASASASESVSGSVSVSGSEIPPDLRSLILSIRSVRTGYNDFARIAESAWYNELAPYRATLPPAVMAKTVQQFVADMENCQEKFNFPTSSLRKRLSIAYDKDGIKTAEDETEARHRRMRARGLKV